ncbi:hypothetical protein [Amaricoccus sp.]|uniref:hypothetical protein n=1 Tax=Amaricoccus sp. TaxID=1872485 RepID=UPI002611C073|nr:hypothetical protein [uncultured Amaricoccus sp.]
MTTQQTETPATLTAEEVSKDAFFTRLGTLAQEMTEIHGREFAMGALVLAARWIAEDRLGKTKPH